MLKKNLLLFYILIFSTILIQCQCGDGPTEPPKDTTRPTIISTTPNQNATNISVSDSVIIVFSEKLQSTSVSNSSITVTNQTPTVTLVDTLIVIKFPAPLNYSTSYTVSIASTISDLAGNTLATDTNITFTTEVDPATLPPTVVSTYPTSGATLTAITDSITATFSKDIDITTINDTTFINDNNITGTVTYNSIQKTVIFKPSSPLDYDSTYTMRLTTLVKDNNGNNLATEFTWTFSTPSITPTANIVIPSDSIIISDTVTFIALSNNPVGIDTVQYYVDGARVGVANQTNNLSSEYVYDASSLTIGTKHIVYSIAYDSLGNFGYSDTLTFFYLWQEVYSELNDGFNQLEVPNDLRKMFVRSTDSTLELRYEYGYVWDSAYWDSTIDLAVFFDTDFSNLTGRRTNGGDTINDIGAEYRALVGVARSDTIIHKWDPNCTEAVCWIGQQTFNDIYALNVPNFSKFLEFGFKWSDIGDPIGVDIVSINVLFRNILNDPLDTYKDYMPDQGLGHVRVYKESRYFGPQTTTSFKNLQQNNSLSVPEQSKYENPFN